MTLVEFLASLREQGVRLSVERDQLRYTAPKGTMTDALRSELAARKAEILAFLQGEDGETAQVPLIRLAAHDGPPPLSFAQQRFWFLDQLEPGSPFYTIPMAVRIASTLDSACLQHSLDAIVRRHAVLRTTFTIVDNQPVQQIAQEGSISIDLRDLSHLPPPRRDAAMASLLAEEVQRPFDLGCGPLLRVMVLRLQPADHVLLLTMHHIISDGWSMDLIIRELVQWYRAFAAQPDPPIPALPIQYADVARRQRQWLQDGLLEARLDYWKKHLRGVTSGSEFPLDHPRPAVQTFRGASRGVTLDPALTQALRALGRHEEATLFVVLLAGFALLLRHYTDTTDIVLGTPVIGRSGPETRDLIGCFVNTLVLRIDLAGDLRVRDLLRRAREVVVAAYAHQDVPFEKLVEELARGRDLSRNPLFQIMLVLQSSQLDAADLPDLPIQSLPIERDTAALDLTLEFRETRHDLIATLTYNTDLFDDATATRLLDQIQHILRLLAADPDRRVAELAVLPEAERTRMLVDWNATALPDSAWPGAYARIDQAIQAQAERTPDAVALVIDSDDQTEQLSYLALSRRITQLAAYLQSLGVGPETRVGVCIDRSADLVIALLGVLRAGGAYVPLDPAYPAQRLVYVLQDAGIAILLTRQALQAELPPHGARTICLDADWHQIAQALPARWRDLAQAEHLAYVIYTSGSTGNPKGVQIEHRALMNFFRGMGQRLSLDAEDTLLAVTTPSFDIAALELFMPLLLGARLALVASAAPADGRLLRDCLGRLGVTAMQATPTTWRLLLEVGWQPDRPFTALCGGEALPSGLAAKLAERVATVWNMYGPTETTIWSTLWRVEPGVTTVAIGRPIANTQISIVNAALQPVPVGAVGELYIGGEGLARGYLGRPDLTAERFIPNPFERLEIGDWRLSEVESPISNLQSLISTRLYRTGDLARYHADGTIECLGRIDYQVKVRGFRIELGEIETTIAQHPAVREAVVTADGSDRLLAYVIPGDWRVEIGDSTSDNLQSPTSNLQHELRAFLRQRLPEYMLPSAFVFLDQFPLTPNGKIDRKRLVQPADRRELADGFLAPQSRLEATVAAIWQSVLRIEQVGIHDNFFELGGHSIALAQVRNRLHDELRIDIAMVDLFRYPTIAELARHLGQQDTAAPLPVDTPALPRAPAAPEIAIVGMAGRFPGAPDLATFWRNLCEGVESIVRFSDAELLAAGVEPALLNHPRYVKAGAPLDGIEDFDAAFFEINPKIAEITDPQHRLFLECAWEVLEHAGYDPTGYPGRIGVYAGTGLSSYLLNNLFPNQELLATVGEYQVMIANDKDYLATRVSYKLNLTGPSLAVQTACSSSLVAVHLACQALLNGECEMALAGGVSINAGQSTGYFAQEGGISAADGHCRPFDASAQGTVFGSGLGLVLLKPLTAARNDQDTIHAIIRGSAINNDGAAKLGFTAPSVDGQAATIAQALSLAATEPQTLGFIETHGTGTPLGDPIEIAALSQVFRRHSSALGWCALGALKANIGHLDAAAGIAGLLKTVLVLQHASIPPTLHFQTPNPHLALSSSPFVIHSRLTAWPAPPSHPRRAGVSSFGIGGTNAHVVLEQAPSLPQRSSPPAPAYLLPLSARTPAALAALAARLAQHLAQHPHLPLADLAFTLQRGRRAFAFRQALVCCDHADALAQLQALADAPAPAPAPAQPPTLVWLLPGQGTQQPAMASALAAHDPIVAHWLDRCAALLLPSLGFDLRARLADPHACWDDTALAQPALFAIGYALAQRLLACGLTPQALLGHSLGELLAATLAGVFALEDALTVVVARGRALAPYHGGALLAVPLGPEALAPFLNHTLSLAALNGPGQSVVGGEAAAVAALAERLAAQGVVSRPLPGRYAFHTPALAPAGAQLAAVVAQVARQAPRIPFLSNVSGTWISEAEATDPAYWGRQLAAPVRFGEAVAAAAAGGAELWVEVGVGATLSRLVRRQLGATGGRMVASLARAGAQDEVGQLLEALGQVWVAGGTLRWEGLEAGEARRVPLPTYPFERQRCWIAPPQQKQSNGAMQGMEEAMTASEAVVTSSAHYEQALTALTAVFHELTGVDSSTIDIHANFFDLGADSLMLVQAGQAIEQKMGVQIPFSLWFDEGASLHTLTLYTNRQLHPEDAHPQPATQPVAAPPVPPPVVMAPAVGAAPAPVPAAAPSTPPVPAPAAGSSTAIEQIVAQQLLLMSEQLALLRGQPPAPPAAAPAALASPSAPAMALPAPALPPQPEPAVTEQARIGPYRPPSRAPDVLTPRQRDYLAEFTARYIARTRESKRLAILNRPVMSELRGIINYRPIWKELVYPIVGQRSAGSQVWDVDGNAYVDLTMGYGVNLFGHSPAFITQALHEQLDLGLNFGAQPYLAGQVAHLICELTGMERVSFHNSGTEAVMAALRVARSATGRSKVALFIGAYHGWSDLTMARTLTSSGKLRSVPLIAGIPPQAVDDLLVLPYGTSETLDILRAHMHELAAVLVEPVQSRNPDLQPRAFLHELRDMTRKAGTLLIFDDMITGFRVHPGGTQAHFGVSADIATYGKVVGGGMPIGVVAGRADAMNIIDGGVWNYGDDSGPGEQRALLLGTFCKHPLALAAAWAALNELKAQGPALQERLNARTSRLAGTLNDYFARQQLPIHIAHFSSFFNFEIGPELTFANLLLYHMIDRDVHIWEWRPSFLATAHTEEDIEHVIGAVQTGVEDMRAGGFLPERPTGDAPPPIARNGHAPAPAHNGNTTPQAGLPPQHATPSAPVRIGLTEEQRPLWVLAQLDTAASRMYNVSFGLDMRGSLDQAALHGAVQQLVDRHEALRITFDPDGAYQNIHPSLVVEIPLIDVTGLPAAERQARIEAVLAEEAQHVFDLARGPLIRVRLLRRGVQHHLLVVTVHHIAVDGWSIGVILEELATLYEEHCRGIPTRLPPAAQLSAYAHRQAQILAGDELRRAEDYWLAQFADRAPILELPTDMPRPARASYRGAHHELLLDGALYAELKHVCANNNSTLFMLLLAGFNLLLHSWSGQDDLVVGVPTAGQLLIGSRNLIGQCVNLVPLRSRFAADTPFNSYLASVREQVIAARKHQIYPFNRLLERLQLDWSTSRLPFVSVYFNLERADPHMQMFELDATFVSNTPAIADFDIRFDIAELHDGLLVRCDYGADLFAPATIVRALERYRTLLRALATQPAQRLIDVPLMTAAERRQIQEEWSHGARTRLPAAVLHTLFEEQAARTPTAAALVWEDGRLSYAELNARANQLAHELRAQGVYAETIVGVSLARSPELVICLLAVLKAGGAYMPLDPAYPAERLAWMLADSGAPIVLSTAALRDSLPPDGTRVLAIDTIWPTIAGYPCDNLPSISHPDSAAYVIYTSGSTGRPKGVLGLHGATVNRLAWMWSQYPFMSSDVCCHKTALNFVDSVWEIFGPLLQGVRAALIPETRVGDVDHLITDLARHGITRLVLVPSLLETLLDSSPDLAARLPDLMLWVSSGEALSPQLADRFHAALPDRALLNLYGSSEVAADATWHHCAWPRDPAATVPIGRPLANIEAYLLDRWMRPVPVGVPGELYIGGAQLARGYLGRPDLTAERFVPSPWSVVSSQLQQTTDPSTSLRASNGQLTTDNRLYRTGDLASFLPDGSLVYHGRRDFQVKVRGFRIELAEIETALLRHPHVRAALVLARPIGAGQGLVAYVVPGDLRLEIGDSGAHNLQSPISNLPQELRAFLKQRLPDYMVPSYFVLLDELPLTPHGKVDRQALLAIEPGQPAHTADENAGPSPIEGVIASVWSQVLGVGQVRRHDNFFALGGHSLFATRIVALLRQLLQVEVELQQLFKAPTVAGLARLIDGAQRDDRPALPPLLPAARKPSLNGDGGERLPLSFAQQRLWFLEQLDPDPARYIMPVALRLIGPLDYRALVAGFRQVVRRHESLRTSFPLADGLPYQRIAHDLAVDMPLVDLRALEPEHADEVARRLALAEFHRPFDLADGPLVRATVLRVDADQHVLVLSMHHSISDGWSIGVLVSETMALYSGLRQGRQVDLPELPIQYADYTVWQRDWLQGQPLRAQLDYWQAQLGNLPTLDLPADYPRPAVETSRGAAEILHLPEALTAALHALSRQQHVTLFMTLLAAFAALLARSSNQDDLALGTRVAGRTQPETESLIGFFVNVLVLRTRLAGNPSFSDLLGRVRTVTLEAYSHQEVPFEKLVEELAPPRDRGRHPFFQVMFVLQNMPLPPLELPDLEVQPISVPSTTAKFDLDLTFTEIDGRLEGLLEYRTDLFKAETIRLLLERYRRVLEAVVANPDMRLADLPLMTAAERQHLLYEWNATAEPYPERCLHALLADQVARTPDAVAVIGEDQQLTYRQLGAQTDALAATLQGLGVGPEVPVGIYLERSVGLVLALVAVVKAGGAFVPLDPAYPPHHLAFQLNDARPPVIVTRAGLSASLPPHSARVIELEGLPAGAEYGVPVPPAVTPESLLGVLYTSGSTGQPKGVALTQRQVLKRFGWMWTHYPLRSGERLCQRSSLNFTVALWEVFGGLLRGAPTIVVPEAIDRDPDALIPWLVTHQVTRITMVPSMLRAILDSPRDLERLAVLRLWSLLGEALTLDLCRQFRERLPSAMLLNQYGASEVLDATCYDAASPPLETEPVPIGRPVSNTTIYLLDGAMQPVPIGVPGVIYVGGEGLARGYLGRPDLTAERFVPNPFSHEEGGGRMEDGHPDGTEMRSSLLNASTSDDRGLKSQDSSADADHKRSPILYLPSSTRLYCMGDIGRYRLDGRLEYLGRRDDQIKLRGVRIEVRGIEAILATHPAVSQAVVVPRAGPDGGVQLVAYVIPGDWRPVLSVVEGVEIGDSAPDNLQPFDYAQDRSLISNLPQELRAFLRERVPEALVPAHFMMLTAFPLTPNGKINRQALPDPRIQAAPDAAFVAPQGELEQTIAAIWQEVLQVPRVGAYDQFFDLGGHSLLLIQLQRKLNAALSTNLSVVDLFQYPTVRALAQRLADGQSHQPSPEQLAHQSDQQRAARRRRKHLRAQIHDADE